MDVFTKKKRSEIMSKIRSRDTKAEKTIFHELKKRGIYFRKYYSGIIGKPDIALPKKKKAIFIDGDFWHGWQFARTKSKLPKKYWREKIEINIKRDKKIRVKLKREGWEVLRIWEHEISSNFNIAIDKIASFLKNNQLKN